MLKTKQYPHISASTVKQNNWFLPARSTNLKVKITKNLIVTTENYTH